MSENPVEVIVAAFNSEHGAEQALKELKAAKKESLIGIKNAAVLRRDAKNKLHVKELKDMGGGKGAAFGGALGAVVGLVAGPAVIVAGAAGALIGGLAAKLRDSGFSNERLAVIGAGLKPGTSAIVAVIEHKWVGELEKAMAEAGADATTAAIAEDIATQLEAGRQVAYTVLLAQEGLAANRVSAGKDDVVVNTLNVSEDSASASNLVATKDAFAVETITVDHEGMTYTIGAALEEPEQAPAEGETAEKPQE